MLRIITFFWIFYASAALAQIAKPQSQSETLRLMRSAVLAEAGTVSAVIDQETQSLLVNQGLDDAATMFPDNLHRKLITADTDEIRQQIFDEHMANLRGQAEIARGGKILPIVRHKDYLTSTAGAGELVHRPLFADLVVVYAEDSPTSVAYIGKERMEELSLAPDALHATALENLHNHDQPLTVNSDPVLHLQYDGFYESSWILMDTVWPQIENQIGPFVMAVPNRNLVLFAPLSDAIGVAGLQEFVDGLFGNEPYPITDQLFEWKSGGWVPYSP